MFRDRFCVSLAPTIPVVVWAPMIQERFGYTAPTSPGSAWLEPVLGTASLAYGGQPFLTGGWQEARDGTPGIMLPIAMAITVAYVTSMANAVGLFDSELGWELTLLIVVMLLGHWLEMRAIGQARGALATLAELLPHEAERITDDDATETESVHDLQFGDVVLVRPGGSVPADGTIV